VPTILKYVILVGPDEAAYEQVDENLKDRVIFLSREKLQVMNDEERNWFLRETVSEVCNWRKSEGLQEDDKIPPKAGGCISV